ncbi:Trk system potassium uptake protein TrkA [mine drainage metagenome]|uniref:Trk system potassium uptake protein TrkA n=1 Tax=mine drainage metagenome TaxID=410659 RepID=A0A1J5PJI2_9ZZZZ
MNRLISPGAAEPREDLVTEGSLRIRRDCNTNVRRRVPFRSVHFVIMGCGRVGSALAHSLEDAGHTVAIIDQNKEAFRRLGAHFKGRTITGVGFDRDTLLEASIEGAHAFAAVSNGDNSNIIAARVVRETFGVENVVARIYDPGRAEIYERLGIPTVATVRWTADRVLRRLLPGGSQTEFRDASGSVRLVEMHVDPSWVGQRAFSVEERTSARLAYLTRLGSGFLPDEKTIIQEGDLIHVLLAEADLEQVEDVLAVPPEAHK